MTWTQSDSGSRFVPAWRVFVLLAVAFVLKLVLLFQLKDHPLTSPDAGLDTTAYVELAQRVLAGDVGLGPGLYYVSPFYIYFLASALALFGSFTAVRGVQIALGTLSVLFIFLTTREWFGERAAWIAAALAALTGLFTFYEVLILQASIDAFLTSAALWALSRRRLLLAGILFGLQTLNRPNMLLAAAGVGLVMLLVTRRIRPVALLAGGLIVGMAPAAIRNAVVARQFSFVSSHGGLNFYIGNSERATGFYATVPGITPTIVGQERDARRVAERALGRPVSDAEASKYFFDLGWSWIAGHPAEAAALFARKLYYVFNAAHTALPHSFPFYASDAGTILRYLVVGPWLLIPLGLAGLLLVPVRGDRRHYLVYASFVPAYAAAVALFFVAERYRLPLLVPLCTGAGALLARVPGLRSGASRVPGLRSGTSPVPGLQTGESGATSRSKSFDLAPDTPVRRPGTQDPPVRRPGTQDPPDRRPGPRIAGAAVIGLAVAANWPLHLNDGRWEEGLRLAQRYVILRDFEAADRWVDRLEASGPPHPGAAHYGVGAQLLLGHEPSRALSHLERAHRAQPANARIEYTLGQALLRTKRAADAVPHLRRGFESGEEIPSGGYDYAEALHATGDVRGAAAIVQRIRLSDADHVEVWLRLGRIAQQGREPAIAEPFFRRAVELRPDLASARQQYGLNLLVLGRTEQAARELTEAVRLDPRDADSLSGLAYCEMQLGRMDAARAHAAAALAINPADSLASGILRRGGS